MHVPLTEQFILIPSELRQLLALAEQNIFLAVLVQLVQESLC